MRYVIYAVAAVVMMVSSEARASCVCQCVNGHLLPLCANAFEIPPICPATGCSIVPVYPQPQVYAPRVYAPAPVYSPVPPPAYQRPVYCRTVRVCDQIGLCRLREICD